MRNLKLFMASLAIALCGFSQAFAADWSAATLEAGKHYFLNVGANKWWGAGNSWGTQASLLPHPEYLTVIVDGSNYKIESQVSNGGTAYYFDGSFMDNGNPASLTIETDGTNYSIANGTTYYGYDGSSTVLATSDNRDSDNFKWQIFTEAQMRARLEAASSSNPVDATFLILDQGFGRNQRNKSAWTMEASNQNLVGDASKNWSNYCGESYHSIFTLSQKIENVPNGLYTLTAQGFYRQDGSDNDNLPYFYINDAKGTFPVIAGTENNMQTAGESFLAGKYAISPISVVVTDGTITLGAKNEVNTSLWCIFDNFTLTFYGDTDPLEASKTLIKATIDEAEAIDVTGLPTAVVDEMKAIVETYKTAYESYTTQAEFDQAIVAIQTAINKVKAYNNAKDCIAKLKALLEETNVYTQEAYETIYANVTKFENAELTVDEANAMNGAIFGTGWHSTAAIDDFLISAWDVDARNWDSYHVNTWSTIGDSGNPNMFTPCIEYWTGDGDKLADKVMTATVAGLTPNGKYSVSIFACPAVNTGENGVAPTGIELQVGEGTPVSLCTGARIAETRFYEGTFTAEGTADAEGNLVIKINVASTNASWLTFRNVKYEAVPEVATWKDIKVDFTNGQILTEAETEIISVGIKMNEDGTATRVAADDASANAIVTGKFHSGQHGLSNFSATVKVEGPVKIGMGSCAWGGNVTVKDENGVEVANAFNTNNGACWATKDGADKNVIYTYYKGEAATLTIAGGSYTPYFSVEKIALEDIPQVMKVSYSLGESGATGILPANFELDGGKTFTLPVNRTLYVEGKTLKGWTDGTKTYAIGEEVTAVADTEISFAPVFTDNTVSLADRKDTVNIVWDFQQKNGAPVVAVQGKTMFWIAQAVVNGDTIDVKMDIDATSGKVANGNWTDWAQINGGTKLTIPAAKGAVISMESYGATTTTTIAGEVINQGTTKPVYTYTGEEATVDIVIGDGSYWRTVAVAIPAVAPQDIVVNVTEGDIAAAVETAKAAVKKVGKITINLTEGAAYTIANSIVAPASLVINGNGATVDATGLGANMITTDAAEPAEWVTIDSIAVKDVTVKGLGKALYYSAIKNQNIQNFVVDNSVVEVAKDVVVFDFTKGSVAMNFTVKNSTLYAPTATTKSIYSSQSAQKGSDAGATADAPQTFTFENTTLYNLGYNKNLFTHRSASQTWIKYVVKNNVVVNTGKANFMTTINQGQDNKNPQYDVTTNSVGTLVDGVYTDLSASQTVQSNVMGTLVTTNPDFKDVANGDFTVGAGSDQAKEKIGDPRWLVEYDNTATAIEGVNATIMNNGDIYTINGVKVRNAGDSLKGLAKGLYIINGKKLIVK